MADVFDKVDPKQSFPKLEKKILVFWEKEKIFERSVEERSKEREYVFYDGPPFATGLPHYGHILAGTMKDVVPRYQTMRGHRVERVFGWDCHGLPVENVVEKELDLSGKMEIEEKVGKYDFNEKCRASVLKYAAEWEETVTRMGRWVDFKNDYKTMNPEFMESVWWVFRQLWDKELIYRGHQPMHICPHCVTPLSNFEVTLGYKDVTDPAVTLKFQLAEDALEAIGQSGKEVYALAWTTTPWTLPGNVALTLGPEVEYVLVKGVDHNDVEGLFILAKARLEAAFGDKEYEVLETIDHKKLEGKHYVPLFDYYLDKGLEGEMYAIWMADFVTTTDGTGVVHNATMFGEDDYLLGKEHDMAMVQHVGMDGVFREEVTDFAGKFVKDQDWAIAEMLDKKGLLFRSEKYKHSYPHCWRCDAPLLNYAMSSWFVDVQKVKEQMVEANKAIHWMPEHVGKGRFADWLENARDWCVSRNRFWGTPLPIWVNEKDEDDRICVGSREELADLSGQEVTDLHSHFVDEIVIEKDGKRYRRVPEVLDCWFESGSMPYAQMHYPFENKEKFDQNFPAEFIAEGLDQTRGWFYTLVVLGTALFGKSPFKNVIVNGLILAEDGKKMSKRLKNYPAPDKIFDEYGADALRFYLMNSPVVRAEPLRFAERGVEEVVRKIMLPIWNSYYFFVTYANIDGWKVDPNILKEVPRFENKLDRWVISELEKLLQGLTAELDNYNLQGATEPVVNFIESLTKWYIRRSRRRFWKSDSDEDKNDAYSTLYYCLVRLCQVIAPFMPFVAEEIYKNLTGEDSVHLSEWPGFDDSKIDLELNEEMDLVRRVVSLGHTLRAKVKIKVRQPLAKAQVALPAGFDVARIEAEKEVILEELNVKELEFLGDGADVVEQEVTVNARVLGPKYGAEVQTIIRTVKMGDFVVMADGKVKVLDYVLEGDEVEVGFKGKEGCDAESDGGVVVTLDTEITPELQREGYARDLVRYLQDLRKEADYQVDDRIEILVKAEGDVGQAVVDFKEYIMSETLADELKMEDDGKWDAVKEVVIDGVDVKVGVWK